MTGSIVSSGHSSEEAALEVTVMVLVVEEQYRGDACSNSADIDSARVVYNCSSNVRYCGGYDSCVKDGRWEVVAVVL